MSDPSEWSNALRNPDKYQGVFSAIESEEILKCSDNDLMKHAKALCVFHTDHRAQDQTTAALFIHGLLLAKIAERFEQANKKTTKLFTVLTVIAVIAGILQAVAAVMGIWPKLTSQREPTTPSHLSTTPQSQSSTTIPKP